MSPSWPGLAGPPGLAAAGRLTPAVGLALGVLGGPCCFLLGTALLS